MNRSNNNDIDRQFELHFDRHSVKVENRDALWNKIHQKKDNRLTVVFLLLGLIFIVGLSYISFKNNHNQEITNKDQSSVATIKPIKSHKTVNLSTNAIIPKSQEKKSNSATILNESHQPNNRTANFIVGQHYNKSLTKNTLDNLNRIIPDSKIGHSNSSNITDTSFEIETKNISTNSIKITKPIKLEIASSPIASIEMKSSTSKETLTLEMITNNNIISPFNVSIVPKEMHFLIIKDKNPLDDCIPGLEGHPYIDIYSVLGNPMETLSLQPGSEDQINYLSDWQEHYSSLPSISMGLMFGYEFKSGLDIAIGAEYQLMQSQYKTTQTIIERVTVYDPMALFFYDDNNDVEWRGDSVTAVSTFDRTVTVANRHSLLHIPLQVSYPIMRKGPWNIKASNLVALNLSFQYRGQFLRSDNSLVLVDANNHANYLSPNVGFSLEIGGHLGYALSPNWEAYISPRFRYNQQSYLLETQLISLQRNFVNLRAGVQYHF